MKTQGILCFKIRIKIWVLKNISELKWKFPPPTPPPLYKTYLMKDSGTLWVKIKNKIWVLGKHLETQNKIPPPPPPPPHTTHLMKKESYVLKSEIEFELNNMKLNSDSSKTSLTSKVDMQSIHLMMTTYWLLKYYIVISKSMVKSIKDV